MGEDLRAETREKIRKETVAAIDNRQPNDTDITRLIKELATIAANYPTPLGGGNMGHVGLVIDDETYKKLSGGHEFIKPTYPGPKTSSQTKAEYDSEIRTFEICRGVEQGLKDKIIEAVEESYLIELEEELIGYMNVTALDMIKHLQERSGGLDHKDVSAIAAERDAEWDVTETPAVYFNKVEKAIKQLERFHIRECQAIFRLRGGSRRSRDHLPGQ
jgi:hypothetical protein